MKKTKSTPKTKRKQKLVIATVAVGAAGVLGYFGWQYLKKRKQRNAGSPANSYTKVDNSAPIDLSELTTETTKASKPTAKPKAKRSAQFTRNDEFPLKKGSKGENVRLLQQAIINQFGAAALPRFGADGAFGTELVNALKKAGLPVTISESTFNVLTKTPGNDTAPAIGKQLVDAASSADFVKAINLLKRLTSTKDYQAANQTFKAERINGVRQTLVTGLLNAFTSESNKQAIRREFLRMGLQFDGNKWSLSGIEGPAIVTTTGTNVWVDAQTSIQVPARMVLGAEVSRRLDYTLFENQGRYFLVQSSHVQPIR